MTGHAKSQTLCERGAESGGSFVTKMAELPKVEPQVVRPFSFANYPKTKGLRR